MATLLLIVVYTVFISLGLPDGVFGGAWPAIYPSLGAAVGLGGIISLLVTSMTIVSSLSTAWLTKKFGVGLLLAISTALTVMGLFGYSQAGSVYWLFLFAVPLGLGAGAIDTALNDYVANHHRAHHMNWLHAFWGIGATAGPIIYTVALTNTGDWHRGYLYLAVTQAFIVGILLLALPLWRKVRTNKHRAIEPTVDPSHLKFAALLKDRAVRFTFASFLLYVGVEVAIGLWLASYLVAIQGVAVEMAALWAGAYYAAITIGRVLTGFIVMKMSNTTLIRSGIIMSLMGVILLLLNIMPAISLTGIVLIGLGFAPIFPGLIHETPKRFGIARSVRIMSLQMVAGYIGATTIPPLIGLLSNMFSLNSVVYVAGLMLALLLCMSELTVRMLPAKT